MARKAKPSLNVSQVGKALITNQYVLYAVVVLALLNLVGYMMVGDYGAMVFFILAGVLSTYFTKNMVITLLSAILLTNVIYRWMRASGMVRQLEGFDNNKKSKKSKKEAMTAKDEPKPATEEEEEEDDDEVEDASRIDHQKTISSAYKHIEKMLGDNGMESITKDAQNLADQQKKLLETMESMQPMMNSMMGVVNTMGGIDQLFGMASKFSGSKV